MIHAASIESATVDEPFYLLSGYGYIKTGELQFNVNHPPLSKLLSAAALLPLDLRVPTESPKWRSGDLSLGIPFLNRNRASPDRIIFQARLPFVGLTLLFGAVLARWARAHFGPLTALTAVALFSLSPGMIAHGHYATTDMVAVIFLFLALLGWERYLRLGRGCNLLLAGVLLGLALCSKFSTLILVVLLPALSLLRWWQSPRDFSLVRFTGSMTGVLAAAAVTVGILYAPETWRAFTAPGEMPKLNHVVDQSLPLAALVHRLSDHINVPAHAFLWGIYDQIKHNQSGHDAYLLGSWSLTGWWYYFPIVLAVKTPVAVLLGMAGCTGFAAAWLIRGLRRGGIRRSRLRRIPFCWCLLVLPPVVFFAVSMTAQINLGHRHILPVYPFLFVLIAAVLARRRWRFGVALVAILALENAFIAPHYLAFFNIASGGSRQAMRYLVDSNLDWGQDLKKLAVWLGHHEVDDVCLAYFGPSDPGYHGIDHRYVPTSADVARHGLPDCVVAVSATLLAGLWNPPETYAWLRQRKPDGHVGYSIYLYDFRQNAVAKQGSSD